MRVCVASFVFACLWSCCCMAGDYDVITSSYGEPELIAGLGQLAKDGNGDWINGWLPAMEGTNALHVELSNTHVTMADAAGNLYLADKASHSVLKMTPEGRIHTVAGTHVAGNGSDTPQPGTNVALANPNGLYVLPEGTVYILDRDNEKIRKLDTNGVMATVVTDTLPLATGRGLWVSADERTIFYTAWSEVRKWTPTGGVEVYSTGYDSLGNIDVDPMDGELVVTDPGDHYVYKVFPDGSRQVIAGNGSGAKQGDGGPATNAGLDEVRGIAFLPHGGYFLASKGDGDIWYVDTNAIAHEFIQGDGSSTSLPYDEICEPRGVSVTPWGDLIITENDNAVVRVARRKLALCGADRAPPSGFSMTWYSAPSADYSLQFSDSLTETNWQERVEMSGTPSNIVTTYTDTNALSVSEGFYRIKRTTP